jgi:hypothetical protein
MNREGEGTPWGSPESPTSRVIAEYRETGNLPSAEFVCKGLDSRDHPNTLVPVVALVVRLFNQVK